MEQCPKCGRYMTWYMWQGECYWKCICGYDTLNINYTKGTDCDRYAIINDKGERVYNCIGCNQMNCQWN